MRQTKGAIGNLLNRYKAVLKKCHLLNTFGSLAVAGMLIMGGAGVATANTINHTTGVHNYTGENLLYSASGDAITANGTDTRNNPQINIGDINTKNITVDAVGGVFAWKSGHIILTAENINLKSSDETGAYSALWAQNNSVNSNNIPIDERASILINAENINIESANNAIVAMSNGIIEINGNLCVKAVDAIVARGDAIININKTGEDTVQLNGNINFNYDGPTSGTDVNATVDIILNGENSYWNGNTLISWNGSPSESSKLTVSEMMLSINNGATWTPTAIENTNSQKYTALNNVSMDGGNIEVKDGVSITLERVTGNGDIDNKGNITLNSANLTVNTLTTSEDSNLSLTEAGSSLTVANTSLDGLTANSLSNAAGSEIIFSSLNEATTLDAIKSLFTADNKGNINVGNLEFDDINGKIVDGKISYEDWKDVGNVTSNELKEATVTDVPGEDNISGSPVSSVQLAENVDHLNVDNVTLSGLGNGNYFVSKSDGSLGGALNYGTFILGDKEFQGQKEIGYIGFGGNDNLLIAKGQDKNTSAIVTGGIQGNGDRTHNIQAENVTLKTQAIGSSENKNSFDIEAISANIQASAEVYANNVSLTDASALSSDTNITVNGALSGTGTVKAAETLKLTQAYTGANADALNLSGANVITGGLDSQHGTIDINADGVLTTTGSVVLAGDTITAKQWDPNGAITASDSVLQAGQFGTEDASTLDQTLTLNDNTLFVHGDATLDEVRAAIADTGHQGTTYYTDKTLNLSADGSGTTAGTLTVGDMASADSNTVAFGADSLLVVDSKALNDKTEAAFTYDGANGTASIETGASLHAVNALHGQTVTIFGEGFGDVTDTWENVSTDTPMLKVEFSDNKKELTVTAEDAREVYPDLSDEMASLVNQYYLGKYNEVSDIAGREFLRRATNSDHYLAGDRKLAASTIESAARIAFAGAVPQMTKMASDAATNAVVNRLGFANPENGAKAMNVDGKIVDDKALGLALWIAPLWSNQSGFGMEAGNLDYGYNANLGGISLGADYTWANNFRAGLMFNIGGGYAESAGGDLSETTNSMTFWGIGAYGGWEYNNFAVMADVSYTSTWNSVDQDLDHRMGMGDLEADIQASAISAGLRFEYKLETQYLDLIPHVGARYMSINTWGYDVESSMGTVLEGDGFQQNIWTFPVGITFSKELEMNNDWYFKPSVDFTVIPAAGDIKAKEDICFTGTPLSAELETQMMDYFTWQGGVGLEFGNDNMSVGVNYTLKAGQNSTGHGVFGMFRYEF